VTAVEATLARGRGALVLVPEVRVGGEVTRALESAFGDAVARLGSDRAARARYADWLALRTGRRRIAVGGRASVFAPVTDLGLIVIDDEAHASYKEGRAPRFHARTVAAERARRAGATLVLVGSPPSVEARAACARGPYLLLAPGRAPERAARPPVTVVDEATALVPHARTLAVASDALASGRRAIFLAHQGARLGRVAERVERILRPRSLARLDAATEPRALARAARSAACLVTTPVIAKDLALEKVGALALLEVDAALTRPEYRAAEEAFATWWRAARWIAGGHVVVETRLPKHPAVLALVRWDPDVLFHAESARRKELGYPPFATVARIDVPADRAPAVVAEVREAGLEALGPVESEGRTVVVARARGRDRLLDALRPVVDRWRATGEPMRVDVDPWEVLVPKWRS
jgi:primosomal protein N'